MEAALPVCQSARNATKTLDLLLLSILPAPTSSEANSSYQTSKLKLQSHENILRLVGRGHCSGDRHSVQLNPGSRQFQWCGDYREAATFYGTEASSRSTADVHGLRNISWNALKLKKRIDAHMDVVWNAQENLPNTLRSTLQETLCPELIAVLREHLTLLDTPSATQANTQSASLRPYRHYYNLESSIKAMRHQIDALNLTQTRLALLLPPDKLEKCNGEASGLPKIGHSSSQNAQGSNIQVFATYPAGVAYRDLQGASYSDDVYGGSYSLPLARTKALNFPLPLSHMSWILAKREDQHVGDVRLQTGGSEFQGFTESESVPLGSASGLHNVLDIKRIAHRVQSPVEEAHNMPWRTNDYPASASVPGIQHSIWGPGLEGELPPTFLTSTFRSSHYNIAITTIQPSTQILGSRIHTISDEVEMRGTIVCSRANIWFREMTI
ncbi:uncharacterized protein PAC_09085 [Phialocephala subalpina]|uniref:Uncharacterized protein n=1 Tax=Phialocephala subalpina TaxID=576137 RepID=A0A1L7X2E2_9HELO|nr:uncharacterized protein PAC_09085 [Phialocephala subalpina]